MVKNYFKKYKRNNLFYAVRGYRKFIQEKKLHEIRLKHNNMHHTVIKSISFKPSFFSSTSNVINQEIILRQFLIQFLIRKLHFNYLMEIGGKKNVSYSAPIEWLNEMFTKKSIKLRIFSKINIFIFSCSRILKSLFLFYIIIVNNLQNKKPTIKSNQCTAYFFDLIDGCIPENSNKNNKNIVNWYINWENKLKNLKTISSNLDVNKKNKINNLKISQDGNPKYFVGSKYNFIKFIIFYIIDFLSSIVYLLFGNSGNAIMLPELTLYRCVNLLGLNSTSGHYLFHYTWTIYRPLWTYIAEQRGSRVSIYFTSITATLKSRFGENNNSFDYYPSSWPEYIVWSENHKRDIKKYCLNEPKIFVENIVPFNTVKYQTIKIPKKSILIFDVEPQNLIKYIPTVGFSGHAEYIYYNKFL